MKPSEIWNSINKGEVTVTFSVKLLKELPFNAVECSCSAYFYGEKTVGWKNVKKFENRDEAIGYFNRILKDVPFKSPNEEQ